MSNGNQSSEENAANQQQQQKSAKRRGSKSSTASQQSANLLLQGKSKIEAPAKVNVEINVPQNQPSVIDQGVYKLKIFVHNKKDESKSEFEYVVDGISIEWWMTNNF